MAPRRVGLIAGPVRNPAGGDAIAAEDADEVVLELGQKSEVERLAPGVSLFRPPAAAAASHWFDSDERAGFAWFESESGEAGGGVGDSDGHGGVDGVVGRVSVGQEILIRPMAV